MGAKPPPKGGLGAKPHSFGNVCGYIAYAPHPKPPHSHRVPLGCLVISVTLILPTQNPLCLPVVPLDCWVVLRDYLVLIYLVLWFFTLFWVNFDVKTAKIETELSPIITGLSLIGSYISYIASCRGILVPFILPYPKPPVPNRAPPPKLVGWFEWFFSLI